MKAYTLQRTLDAFLLGSDFTVCCLVIHLNANYCHFFFFFFFEKVKRSRNWLVDCGCLLVLVLWPAEVMDLQDLLILKMI